jgi:imidazoleglycerol phosphate dehydratase HisB
MYTMHHAVQPIGIGIGIAIAGGIEDRRDSIARFHNDCDAAGRRRGIGFYDFNP